MKDAAVAKNILFARIISGKWSSKKTVSGFLIFVGLRNFFKKQKYSLKKWTLLHGTHTLDKLAIGVGRVLILFAQVLLHYVGTVTTAAWAIPATNKNVKQRLFQNFFRCNSPTTLGLRLQRHAAEVEPFNLADVILAQDHLAVWDLTAKTIGFLVRINCVVLNCSGHLFLHRLRWLTARLTSAGLPLLLLLFDASGCCFFDDSRRRLGWRCRLLVLQKNFHYKQEFNFAQKKTHNCWLHFDWRLDSFNIEVRVGSCSSNSLHRLVLATSVSVVVLRSTVVRARTHVGSWRRCVLQRKRGEHLLNDLAVSSRWGWRRDRALNALYLAVHVVLEVAVNCAELGLYHVRNHLTVVQLVVVRLLQLTQNRVQTRKKFRFLVAGRTYYLLRQLVGFVHNIYKTKLVKQLAIGI